jgi:cell division protein FtsX
MKSWIKGGLIGTILGGISIIVLNPLYECAYEPWLCPKNLLNIPSQLIVLILLTTIIIGALIGWIVGKIKNKNEGKKK